MAEIFFCKYFRVAAVPEYIPIKMIKISNLPKIIPSISITKVAVLVDGPVIPIDKPTVPSAEANSNIASVREQFAVKVNNSDPAINMLR